MRLRCFSCRLNLEREIVGHRGVWDDLRLLYPFFVEVGGVAQTV